LGKVEIGGVVTKRLDRQRSVGKGSSLHDSSRM